MIEPSGKTVAALEAAVAAVKAAKVPKDLRVAAFDAAFYGSKATPVGTAETPEPPPAPSPPAGEQADGVKKIAAKLELDEEIVSRVYDVDEDGVHLTIKPNILSPTKKFAQQEVTYLLAAGRQAVGLEEWTPAKIVIEATHDRGVHDTNVSKAVTALDGDGFRFRGTKGKREMKISAVGFSKAAEIVTRLTEAS
jgi:hypothetical protein